jgi:hypothetical protein
MQVDRSSSEWGQTLEIPINSSQAAVYDYSLVTVAHLQ